MLPLRGFRCPPVSSQRCETSSVQRRGTLDASLFEWLAPAIAALGGSQDQTSGFARVYLTLNLHLDSAKTGAEERLQEVSLSGNPTQLSVFLSLDKEQKQRRYKSKD